MKTLLVGLGIFSLPPLFGQEGYKTCISQFFELHGISPECTHSGLKIVSRKLIIKNTQNGCNNRRRKKTFNLLDVRNAEVEG